ncbi:MAG: hypothetical protein ACYDDV_06875 [Methanoregula sp.]
MDESKIQDLKNYLLKIIDEFRIEYNSLDDSERKYLDSNTIYSVPCQIEIFWVSEPSEFQLLVLTHNSNRPDKEIKINGPFHLNEIANKVIEIMDEPRWREKAPHLDDGWSVPSDAGYKEHKYSDEFANLFSHFLNQIRHTSSQYFPPGSGTSYLMGQTDFCIIIKGNIAELPSSELDQKSSIESAKQQAASVKTGFTLQTIQKNTPEKEKSVRKFFGSYYTPGARIGDNVELTFKEKISGPDIFEYPKYEYAFTFNGRMGFYDRYGLVIIGSENEEDAIKIINTIFGISIIHGIEAFSVRKSDILETQTPINSNPLGQSLGSYRRKISEITGQAPNLFEGMKRSQITFEKMERTIEVSEKIFLDEKVNQSLLFLLEGNTHLKNSEFPQSYIFCWLIVEQYISKKFNALLTEKPEIKTKLRNKTDPEKEAIGLKFKILNSNERLSDSDYSFLTVYKDKRNDFVHSGKTIMQSDAEKLFDFSFRIIQNEIAILDRMSL